MEIVAADVKRIKLIPEIPRQIENEHVFVHVGG